MIRKISFVIIVITFVFVFIKDDPIQYMPGSYKSIGGISSISLSLNKHFSKEEWAIPVAFIKIIIKDELTISKARHLSMPVHQKPMNVIIEEIYYQDSNFDIDVKDKIILSVSRNLEIRPSYEYEKNDEYLCIIYDTSDIPNSKHGRYKEFSVLHGDNFIYKYSDDENYIYAIRGDFTEFTDVSLELCEEEINSRYIFKAKADEFIKIMTAKLINYITDSKN